MEREDEHREEEQPEPSFCYIPLDKWNENRKPYTWRDALDHVLGLLSSGLDVAIESMPTMLIYISFAVLVLWLAYKYV